jgi:hypothetical protein
MAHSDDSSLTQTGPNRRLARTAQVIIVSSVMFSFISFSGWSGTNRATWLASRSTNHRASSVPAVTRVRVFSPHALLQTG